MYILHTVTTFPPKVQLYMSILKEYSSYTPFTADSIHNSSVDNRCDVRITT
jgi:hypothetical protein